MTDPQRPPSSSSRMAAGEEHDHQEGQQSVSDLLSTMLQEVSDLFRQELQLAKAEARTELRKTANAAGKLVAAGVLGLVTLLLFTMAVAWGLAELMAPGLAFLIVTVVVGAIAFGLFSAGKKQLEKVNPKPEQATAEMKETKEWAKQQ